MRYEKLIPAVAVAVLVAGCGSSSSSSSASQPAGGGQATSSTTSAAAGTTAAAATTSAAAATTSAAAAAGPYGAASASRSSGRAAPVVDITTKHSKKLGTILAVGTKEMTVYLFEADHGSTSSCTGACAKVWPPVIGTPRAAGGALKADLGTVTRADGTRQVTYKGHPLYGFIKDGDDGDAYGQGLKSFGAPWYVLAPSGGKVDES